MFIHYISAKRIAADYIKHLNKENGSVNMDHYRLTQHILSCQLKGKVDPNGFVPAPYDFLEEKFGSKFTDVMGTGLFSFQPHSHITNQCRGYRLKDEIVSRFCELNEYIPGQIKDNLNSLTLAEYKAEHKINQDNGHSFPELVVKSMQSISPCPINKSVLIRYRDYLPKGHSDLFHVNSILNTMENDCYQPAYIPSSSGRIFERFGIQSCSKAMRAQAMHNIDCFNYDLKSSQAAGMLHQFHKSNIDCLWLESYINNDDFRKTVIGCIPKHMFKGLFYALCFGSDVNHSYKSMMRKDSGKKLWKEFKKMYPSAEPKDLAPLLAQFCKNVEPLRDALESWKDYMLNNNNFKKIYFSNGRSGTVVTNSCGMKLKISGMKEQDKKRKLSAHILQGSESCFIHNLTILCKEEHIMVLSNAHDGLVVTKKIPQELVAEAKVRSGLDMAELEIKGIGE